MIPDTDERLASVIRALTDVVMPALPPEAGLAQEQLQLCLGQIQILRAQLDLIPAFEAEELADALALARSLMAQHDDAELRKAIVEAESATSPTGIRDARKAVHAAIATLIAQSAGRSPADRWQLHEVVLRAETLRATKDRHWFAPFGFDTIQHV